MWLLYYLVGLPFQVQVGGGERVCNRIAAGISYGASLEVLLAPTMWSGCN